MMLVKVQEQQEKALNIHQPTTVNIIGNYIEKTAHNSILISGHPSASVSITGNTLKLGYRQRQRWRQGYTNQFDPVDANTDHRDRKHLLPKRDDDSTDLDYVKITVSTANNNVNNLICNK